MSGFAFADTQTNEKTAQSITLSKAQEVKDYIKKHNVKVPEGYTLEKVDSKEISFDDSYKISFETSEVIQAKSYFVFKKEIAKNNEISFFPVGTILFKISYTKK